MTPMIQPARTVISIVTALDALADAHESVIGGEIGPSLLLVLAAHSSFETARWRSMWCWNFGNIRGQWNGQWTSLKGAGEFLPGQTTQTILDVGPGNAFRAYPDMATGAEDYLAFLGVASHPPEPNRFQAAWDAALRCDVHGFCAGLKAGKYFTDGIEHYTRSVEQHARDLRGEMTSRYGEPLPMPEQPT